MLGQKLCEITTISISPFQAPSIFLILGCLKLLQQTLPECLVEYLKEGDCRHLIDGLGLGQGFTGGSGPRGLLAAAGRRLGGGGSAGHQPAFQRLYSLFAFLLSIDLFLSIQSLSLSLCIYFSIFYISKNLTQIKRAF